MVEHRQQGLYLEEDEADEALSLCDLPLEDHEFSELPRPSPPSSSDFFEFFIGSSDDVSPAGDIFFCGKLVPYKVQHSSLSPPLVSDNKQRSESISDLQNRVIVARSDSRKLQRFPKSPEIKRKSSGNSVDGSDKKAPGTKPRWYLMRFGMVRLPPEMELRDIKSRNVRRNPSVLFTPADGSDSGNFRSSAAGKGSWGLLRALSCKDHSSVNVTTPFGRMPQA